MQFFRRLSRIVAPFMAGVMILISIPLGAAQAGLVSTEAVIERAQADHDRARVLDFMSREQVRDQIRALGVDPDEASARVSALSDMEISRIAGRIDALPAGQNAIGAVLGVALFIFLVLLLTDILGLTNVFPFVRR